MTFIHLLLGAQIIKLQVIGLATIIILELLTQLTLYSALFRAAVMIIA